MFEQLCLVDRAVRTVLRVTVQAGPAQPWLAPGAPAQQQRLALRLWLVDSQGCLFRRTVRVRRTGAFPARPHVVGWRWAPAPGGTCVVVQLGSAGGTQPAVQLAEGGRCLRLGSVELPELVGDVQARVGAVACEVLPGHALLRVEVTVEGYGRAADGTLRHLQRSAVVEAQVAVAGLQPPDELTVLAQVAAVQRSGLPGQIALTVRFGGWAVRPMLRPGEGGYWLERQVLAPLAAEERVTVDLGETAAAVTWVEGEAELPGGATELLFARAYVDRRGRILIEVVLRGAGLVYHCLRLPGTGLPPGCRVGALELTLRGEDRLQVAAAVISG